MLDYVLCDGHRDGMLILIKMYEDLMANKEMTAENLKQAHVLGWCLEIVSLPLSKSCMSVICERKP